MLVQGSMQMLVHGLLTRRPRPVAHMGQQVCLHALRLRRLRMKGLRICAPACGGVDDVACESEVHQKGGDPRRLAHPVSLLTTDD